MSEPWGLRYRLDLVLKSAAQPRRKIGSLQSASSHKSSHKEIAWPRIPSVPMRSRVLKRREVSGEFVIVVIQSMVLAGYAFLGRGFAGVAVGGVYIGEWALWLCVLGAFLVSAARHRGPLWAHRPLLCTLIAYMTWGAIRTVPYFEEYGTNCLRDGVLWGYGVFAVSTYILFSRPNTFTKAVSAFRSCITPFLCWAPVAGLSRIFYVVDQPDLPQETPLFFVKSGDMAVLIAGCATFLVLNPSRGAPYILGRIRGVPVRLWLLVAPAMLLNLRNRAGILATALALVSAFVLGPFKARLRIAGVAGILVVLGFFLRIWYPSDLYAPRRLGFDSVNRFASVLFARENESEMDGSSQWRVLWWREIINYTVFGEYFWLGKGFGINLAYSDGRESTQDVGLRSPHNSHLNVLARSGVPGFSMWIALHVSLCAFLVRSTLRARSVGDIGKAALYAWLLSFLLAFLTNACFDVAFESPQNAIWFWSLFGFAWASLRHDHVSTSARRHRHGAALS